MAAAVVMKPALLLCLIMMLNAALALSLARGASNNRPRYRRLRHGSFGFRHAVHQTPADYRPDYRRPSYKKEYSDDDGYGSLSSYGGGEDGASGSPTPMADGDYTPFPDSPFRPLVTASKESPCKTVRQCSDRDKKYRSMDGSCNNLRHPSSGQSNQPFVRLVPRKHSLINCGTGKHALPNPRLLSRAMVRRGEDSLSPRRSAMLWNYGQFVDHDIELTPPRQTEDGEFLDCCAEENRDSPDCCPIDAPSDDPFFGKEGRPTCMPFIRSLETKRPSSDINSCKKQKPDIANANTAWVDLSSIYGSEEQRSKELRLMRGGLMKTHTDNRGRHWAPMGPKEEDGDPEDVKMEFGDDRGDVTPGQTMICTIFLRNHNRIAKQLGRMHPDWDDERLFQEARKINVAVHQNIVYTQFLDELLGTPNNVGITEMAGKSILFYDPKLDGTISVGFGTAGYRLHTYVSGHIHLRNTHFQRHGQLRLRDIFHKPKICMSNNTMDDVMRGLCGQPLSRFDNIFTPEMTEWLFPEDDANFGNDIAALNIQRGRDHQIQGYPSYRDYCGLGEAKNWNDITDLISPTLVHRLLHVYKRIDDVDLYVAGNMESPVKGSLLGPTFHCLVRDQFERLRNADRFFFTNPGQFSSRQLSTIGKMTLARIMCDNSDNQGAMSLPANVFRVADSVHNPVVSCANTRVHPTLDLSAWQ